MNLPQSTKTKFLFSEPFIINRDEQFGHLADLWSITSNFRGTTYLPRSHLSETTFPIRTQKILLWHHPQHRQWQPHALKQQQPLYTINFFLFNVIVETKRTKQHFARVSLSFCELKRKKANNFVTYFFRGEIELTQQYNAAGATVRAVTQREQQRKRQL